MLSVCVLFRAPHHVFRGNCTFSCRYVKMRRRTNTIDELHGWCHSSWLENSTNDKIENERKWKSHIHKHRTEKKPTQFHYNFRMCQWHSILIWKNRTHCGRKRNTSNFSYALTAFTNKSCNHGCGFVDVNVDDDYHFQIDTPEYWMSCTINA